MEKGAVIALWAFQAADTGSTGSEVLEYVKLIAILACVLVFVILVLRVGLPKLSGMRITGSSAIRIAASAGLEPRKNLYVIKAGSDYFLVATSESAVNVLSPLEAEHIEPFLRAEGDGARPVEFSRLLKTFRPRGGSS